MRVTPRATIYACETADYCVVDTGMWSHRTPSLAILSPVQWQLFLSFLPNSNNERLSQLKDEHFIAEIKFCFQNYIVR